MLPVAATGVLPEEASIDADAIPQARTAQEVPSPASVCAHVWDRANNNAVLRNDWRLLVPCDHDRRVALEQAMRATTTRMREPQHRVNMGRINSRRDL